MTNLEKAKELYKENNYTCVIYKDGDYFSSFEKGVKPLVQNLDLNKTYEGYSAADKIVGKAAAMLYVLLKVKEIYADVISSEAVKYLKEHNVDVTFEVLTDKIINRKGDGICPMEESVLDIEDAYQGYLSIKNKIKQLSKK